LRVLLTERVPFTLDCDRWGIALEADVARWSRLVVRGSRFSELPDGTDDGGPQERCGAARKPAPAQGANGSAEVNCGNAPRRCRSPGRGRALRVACELWQRNDATPIVSGT
jgi:hypothetical protein